MWRAITYGNKHTKWFICYADMAKHANKVYGLGNWTYEFKSR